MLRQTCRNDPRGNARRASEGNFAIVSLERGKLKQSGLLWEIQPALCKHRKLANAIMIDRGFDPSDHVA